MLPAPEACTTLHVPHHKRDLLAFVPVLAIHSNLVDFQLDHNLKLLLIENVYDKYLRRFEFFFIDEYAVQLLLGCSISHAAKISANDN